MDRYREHPHRIGRQQQVDRPATQYRTPTQRHSSCSCFTFVQPLESEGDEKKARTIDEEWHAPAEAFDNRAHHDENNNR